MISQFQQYETSLDTFLWYPRRFCCESLDVLRTLPLPPPQHPHPHIHDNPRFPSHPHTTVPISSLFARHSDATQSLSKTGRVRSEIFPFLSVMRGVRVLLGSVSQLILERRPVSPFKLDYWYLRDVQLPPYFGRPKNARRFPSLCDIRILIYSLFAFHVLIVNSESGTPSLRQTGLNYPQEQVYTLSGRGPRVTLLSPTAPP